MNVKCARAAGGKSSSVTWPFERSFTRLPSKDLSTLRCLCKPTPFFQEIQVWYCTYSLFLVSPLASCANVGSIWGPHHAHTLAKLHSQDPPSIIFRKNWVTCQQKQFSISGYAMLHWTKSGRNSTCSKPGHHALQTLLHFQQASLSQALAAQLPIFTHNIPRPLFKTLQVGKRLIFITKEMRIV